MRRKPRNHVNWRIHMHSPLIQLSSNIKPVRRIPKVLPVPTIPTSSDSPGSPAPWAPGSTHSVQGAGWSLRCSPPEILDRVAQGFQLGKQRLSCHVKVGESDSSDSQGREADTNQSDVPDETNRSSFGTTTAGRAGPRAMCSVNQKSGLADSPM